MTYEAAFAALADPTRRKILEALREGPCSVTELAERVPVSRPAVSQHLAVLRAAELVFDRQEGTRRLYAADPAGLETLKRYLETFWGEALSAFAARAGTVKRAKAAKSVTSASPEGTKRAKSPSKRRKS